MAKVILSILWRCLVINKLPIRGIFLKKMIQGGFISFKRVFSVSSELNAIFLRMRDLSSNVFYRKGDECVSESEAVSFLIR